LKDFCEEVGRKKKLNDSAGLGSIYVLFFFIFYNMTYRYARARRTRERERERHPPKIWPKNKK
jgi:hypothetical protein